ncbi:MAG: 30S ribosomal protein S17 [Sandaracinaceae bacterium]|nr:30S ribosomal protein S17 [Sandaracinaceae bacterium]
MSEEANSSTRKAPTPKKAGVRGQRRKLIGKVVSDTSKPGRAKKTIVVEVTRFFRDPVYGKYVQRRRKFHAHDETEQYKTNDLVEIRESRPLSATKRWEAIRLVERPVEV